MAKILVIDDDGIVRDSLKAFLTREGHTVFMAADGLNGLALFKNIMPEIVILDREMPNLTGSQVLAKIRDFSKSIPVIILTGYDSAQDAEEYIKSGATSFVSKSLGLAALLEEVNRLCPNKTNPEKYKTKKEETPLPQNKLKALIADDDENVRNMVSRFLSSLGLTTLTAKNGEEAVKTYFMEKPDILLLDIFMPKKNGIDVLKEIMTQFPNSSIMMITGNDEEELARECLKLGAFDYISKPLNLKNLEISIKTRFTTM